MSGELNGGKIIMAVMA